MRPRRRTGRPSTKCGHCGERLYYHPVIEAAACRWGYPVASLHARASARRGVSLAKQVAAFLLRQEGHTWRAIGAALNRGEDWPRKSCKRIERLLKSATMQQLVKEVREEELRGAARGRAYPRHGTNRQPD